MVDTNGTGETQNLIYSVDTTKVHPGPQYLFELIPDSIIYKHMQSQTIISTRVFTSFESFATVDQVVVVTKIF